MYATLEQEFYILDTELKQCIHLYYYHLRSHRLLLTIACRTLLLMEFSRQEYWSGLPFTSPGDLRNSAIFPTYGLLHWGRFFTIWATREAQLYYYLQVKDVFSCLYFVSNDSVFSQCFSPSELVQITICVGHYKVSWYHK